jgi:hypothetical protein
MSKREDAFASFGTKLRNRNGDGRARSPDGYTVAATFWRDSLPPSEPAPVSASYGVYP